MKFIVGDCTNYTGRHLKKSFEMPDSTFLTTSDETETEEDESNVKLDKGPVILETRKVNEEDAKMDGQGGKHHGTSQNLAYGGVGGGSGREFGAEITPRQGGMTTPVDCMRLFKEQEVENGNCIDWKTERKKVEFFCKWSLYGTIKFPTQMMLEFSMYKEGMTKEERYGAYGLICRSVIEKFAKEIQDKRTWWSMVQGVCVRAIGRRRDAVRDGVKKRYLSK